DGDCDPAVVTITVVSVDDFPVANDDTATTNEDTPVTVSVLTNDTFGGDGPSSGAITVLSATGGTATVNNNGTPTNPTDDRIVFTPTANFNGTATVTYQICDSDGDCDPAVVTITVVSVDDFSVANDDTATTNEDTPVTVSVLTNDTFGGDGPSSGAITVLSATGGTATVNNNGTPTNPTD